MTHIRIPEEHLAGLLNKIKELEAKLEEALIIVEGGRLKQYYSSPEETKARDAEILSWYYIDKLSKKEIAKKLGITLNGAHQAIQRTKRRNRDFVNNIVQLQNYWDNPNNPKFQELADSITFLKK